MATKLEALEIAVYRVPTDAPESDGTFEWNSTTMVLVEAVAGGQRGLGYTYTDAAAAGVIRELLAPVVLGHEVMNIAAAWDAMVARLRNAGRPGLGAMALSAVDSALWDLKARLLGLPLVTLLGAARGEVPVYGSGGFTSYGIERLQEQLAGWAGQGIPRVKMKIGRVPAEDVSRVRAARLAVGDRTELFVDANGAYEHKQALALAREYAMLGVVWFEEPVSSDDLEGLQLLRRLVPPPLRVAAGEYGCDPWYFQRMLAAGAVDVLQADVTRCLGVTGFLRAAAIADAHQIPLSGHCAPALHLHPGLAAPRLAHLEYFHDHARLEPMLFDGVAVPRAGALHPDLSRPGNGLELRRADAERFRV